MTGRACGDAFDQVRCTVTDQTISAPFVVVGRKADTMVSLPLGPLGKYPETTIDNVALLDVRLIDPTGATFAVPGVTGVRSLVGLRVDIKGDRLRVRGTIPVGTLATTIDPTLEGGATITLSDRDGAFYTVTIPETRWQDQTPLGSRWTYLDPGGVLAGVRKASLKRNGKPGCAEGLQARSARGRRRSQRGRLPEHHRRRGCVRRPDDPIFGFTNVHRAQRNCTGVFKGPSAQLQIALRSRDPGELVPGGALEQHLHRLLERPAAVQHLVDVLGDRHLDPELRAERVGGGRGREALGDRALAREIRLGVDAERELLPERAVAREVAGAGEDQVADARHAEERERVGAERHAEAGHLREPAA